MEPITLILLLLLFAAAAALYSSVGHGGASAYLALMALFAMPVATMRPTALVMNLLVAGFAALRYFRAGEIDLRLLFYFALSAAPFAFLGGMITLAPEIYRPLLGILLWCTAARLLWRPDATAERPVTPAPPYLMLPFGMGLGFLAGLTGTGGGIFLSPVILMMGWASPRITAGIASCFILINSAAGLAGNLTTLRALPADLPLFLAAAGTGAFLGIWLGLRRLPQHRLVQLLAIVLFVAGSKLVLT